MFSEGRLYWYWVKFIAIFLYFKFEILLHVSVTFLRSSFVITFPTVLYPLFVFLFSCFLFSLFFQIFFWRYRQLISFSSFSDANFSSKLDLPFECLFLFSQSEIRYFCSQELSHSQNDSSKLPFTSVCSIMYGFMLTNYTFRLNTLN